MMQTPFRPWSTTSAVTGVLLAFAVVAAPGAMAEPAALDLSCSGNSYGKTGDPFPTAETVAFTWDGRKLVMLDLPGADKPTKASVVSSNPIQLKFSAGGVTGEYFNFSGDLFLIHKDGRFTRLVCKPKA
jgi:hypothetical protein